LIFAVKDLWLGIIDKKDKKELYKIYDNYCSKYKNYNKENNKNIFKYLDPIVNINYII